MAEYKNEDCPFVYRIEAVTKVVDGLGWTKKKNVVNV